MSEAAAIFEFPSGVRRADVSDIPQLVLLARYKYPEYELVQAEAWAHKIITSPNAAIFICRSSVAIVAWQCEMWLPNERVADVLPMFGITSSTYPWAQFRVLKAACEWAKQNGCYAIRFGSSIGAKSKNRSGIDLFAAYAKRIGARVFGITYILELR